MKTISVLSARGRIDCMYQSQRKVVDLIMWKTQMDKMIFGGRKIILIFFCFVYVYMYIFWSYYSLDINLAQYYPKLHEITFR